MFSSRELISACVEHGRQCNTLSALLSRIRLRRFAQNLKESDKWAKRNINWDTERGSRGFSKAVKSINSPESCNVTVKMIN